MIDPNSKSKGYIIALCSLYPIYKEFLLNPWCVSSFTWSWRSSLVILLLAFNFQKNMLQINAWLWLALGPNKLLIKFNYCAESTIVHLFQKSNLIILNSFSNPSVVVARFLKSQIVQEIIRSCLSRTAL